MTGRPCKSCGTKCVGDARECPTCGAAMPTRSRSFDSIVIVIGVFAGLGLLFIVLRFGGIL